MSDVRTTIPAYSAPWSRGFVCSDCCVEVRPSAPLEWSFPLYPSIKGN